jgi:hypothetical protein
VRSHVEERLPKTDRPAECARLDELIAGGR